MLKLNYALLEIAKILKKNDIELIESWISKTQNGINNKLYFDGFYYYLYKYLNIQNSNCESKWFMVLHLNRYH